MACLGARILFPTVSLGKKMPWQLRSMSSLSLRRKIDLDSLPEGVANLSIGTYIAGWSSLVARKIHYLEVVGSNPSPATKCPYSITESARAF